MKKLFVILSFLISMTCVSSQSWGLPACTKSGYKHNCYGTNDDGNGVTYTGEWKNNLADGQGTLTMSDGERYEGSHKKNKKHGIGTYTFVSGHI